MMAMPASSQRSDAGHAREAVADLVLDQLRQLDRVEARGDPEDHDREARDVELAHARPHDLVGQLVDLRLDARLELDRGRVEVGPPPEAHADLALALGRLGRDLDRAGDGRDDLLDDLRHEPLGEGDRLGLGDSELRVLHTPGHTPGSLTLYLPDQGMLFTGDTLLKGGAGHTAEPGASLDALAVSVRRLAAFPESTVVYPGHGAPTTIGGEAWLAGLSDPDAPLVQWRAGRESRRTRS